MATEWVAYMLATAAVLTDGDGEREREREREREYHRISTFRGRVPVSVAMLDCRRMSFLSLDWFKGKPTGNHGFYHQI